MKEGKVKRKDCLSIAPELLVNIKRMFLDSAPVLYRHHFKQIISCVFHRNLKVAATGRPNSYIKRY